MDVDTAGKVTATNHPDAHYFDRELFEEVEVMYRYARKNGLDLPPAMIARCTILSQQARSSFSETEIGELADIHHDLTALISPATPQAVMLMNSDRNQKKLFKFLGAVPLVRNIMLTATCFLVMFVAVGQLQIVNEENLVKGILGSSGWNVVAIIAYLVSCAGLGACFAALFKLNTFISSVTYDPRFDSTYWASIILGVIAGIFISELLYEVLFGHPVADPAGGQTVNDTSQTLDMGKPFLALIGGFSANMVYKIMQRLVDTIESLFKGDPTAQRQAQKQADQAALKQRQGEMQMDMANRLMPMTELLDSDPDKARSELKGLVDQLLSKQ